MTLLSAVFSFAPPSIDSFVATSSPFRGQSVHQAWHATATANTSTSIVVEAAELPAPLPLDEWADTVSALHKPPPAALDADSDAYWDFLPAYMGSAVPSAEPTGFSTSCFGEVTVTATLDEEEQLSLTFHAKKRKKLVCSDLYILTTSRSVHLELITSLSLSATHKVKWSGLKPFELADVRASGVRICRFEESLRGTVHSAFETALLFAQPMLFAHVTKAAAERNIHFLEQKATGAIAPHEFEPRTKTDVVPDESEVADGDMLCILRLDGLDPLINWGTGGNCGHSVMALRFDGVLHIVESQAKSGYWPKDFIQRNKFADWIQMAKKASYNVLHLRLSAESRAKFNASAAVAAFETTYEGVPYGFENMLWGWFDGPVDNFPPPLDVHLVGTLLSIFDPIARKVSGDTPSLWNGAISHRLGVPLRWGDNTSTAALLDAARRRNITFGDILRMPEEDSWRYPLPDETCARLKRPKGCTAPKQVCNVFVCKMWVEGGMLGDDFNCGEQTPLDTYGMTLFDTAPPLSDACRAADPMNTKFCQILGDWRMKVPRLATVAPHAHMSERCPSKAPDYAKRFDPKVASSC